MTLNLFVIEFLMLEFFLDCSILDAKESTIGSYAWKSILSARDVIQKGMVWQIGNGHWSIDSIERRYRWIPIQCNTVSVSQLPSIQTETKPKLRLALSLILILVSGNRNW